MIEVAEVAESENPTLVRIDKKIQEGIKSQAFIRKTSQYDLLNEILATWLKSQPDHVIKVSV